MKKTKITLIIGWLLFLSSNLFAQNSEGLFKLKEGDWFEVQVEQNGYKSFLLNYQLQKQLPNKNQLYKIQLEHYKVKSKIKIGNDYMGYDSYYPTFEENRTSPEVKNQFSLEISPAGRIVRITPSKNNKSRIINLTTNKAIEGSIYNAKLHEKMSDSVLFKYFSGILMKPILNPKFKNTDKIVGIRYKRINDKDSIPIDVPYLKERRVPLLIKLTDLEFLLTDASFPLIDNTIIQGKVKDQVNQEIKISMIGENPEYNFPEKQFRTNSDGSFNCPIFLKRPLHLRIQIGSQTLTTFMESGDTLNIYKIGHQAIELPQNHYSDTKPNGYFSPNIKKSDYFSGSAAYNTMLSNEIDQYRNQFSRENGVQAVISYCQETTKAVDELIDSYEGKASKTCVEYFKSDWKYFIASDKYSFYEQYQMPGMLSSTNSQKKDIPLYFFMEGDTMPVSLNSFEWNSSYQSFITKAQLFKQIRLGWAFDRSFSESFLKDYSFSQASLQGYPLYNQIAKSITYGVGNGFLNVDYIKPYYQDFINNCADPALVEPMKEVYKTVTQLKIGNRFPVKSFDLKDSSIFNLEKYNGKPICLILLYGPKSLISGYMEEISKFRQEEVEFIIARLPMKNWMKGKIDSTILEKPNVTYIQLSDKNIASKLFLDRTKIFMIDKWFRIVENNAEDPMTHIYKGSLSEFEKSLRKTIETKRYSKAEKTVMIKTAGWSFVSILFTFLGGLWIYRIRIRRIKTQEAAKRRIKELEIKAIRSQMNPHFIFNALNSIQSLINGNQFKEANIYLSKFAVLLRGVLNNSEKSRISLSDELQAVELYCQLEQLRFEFKFEISIAPEVNADLIEIPGMIIQPLAENAVVHGLSGKGDQGKLNIQVKRQNGNLCICVSDNGVGLPTETTDTLSQKGFGLKLVEERINILNLDGKEAKLTVENQNNTAGTVATLIIPID